MRHLRPALLLLASLSLLTGLVYPLAVTALAQLVFPHRANGSLIEVNGTVVGSELIGQRFASDRHFWSRPSATSPPYNAASSTGSNLGPTNPALYERVRADIERLRKSDPAASTAPPVDLVTTSGSGLDPDISLAAAAYQVERVARARGLTSEAVRRLVAEHTTGRTFGILGEPRVNVLELNLALERLPAAPPATTHPPA